MIFRNFLAWAQTASAASRVEGASALARAWLESDLGEEERADAEVALTALLDDPSPDVRRAMAVELAGAADAPRHVISALASDQSDISVPVLSRSPLLGEGELCECATFGDVYAQAAIALRPGISEAVAWTIADCGAREAAISLAVNISADTGERVLRRMLERHGGDGEVREAILSRGDLPASIRADLVAAAAASLNAFVTGCGWMAAERAERTCREARETGLVEIAASETGMEGAPPPEFARHLRQQSQLTPGLLLRGLLSGNRSLFQSSVAELSSLPADRVAGFVSAWSGAGFAAIYGRCALPAGLLPVFRAALAAQDEYGLVYAAGQRPQLSRLLVDRTLRSLEAMPVQSLGRVIALLHRLRAEAARTEARALSGDLIAAALAPPVIVAGLLQDAAQDAPNVEIDLDAIEADIAAAA